MENVTNQQDSEENPYRTPQAELIANKPTNLSPDYKLYKLSGINIATFLFSVHSSSILLAINFKRLGKSQHVMPSILGGLLCLIATMALSFILPDDFPGLALALPVLLGMGCIAYMTQAESIQAHIDAGGELESNWKAVGVGFLVIIPAAILFIVAIFFYTQSNYS